jgi:pimeloyl-ACP methyl ester carboxylesterase
MVMIEPFLQQASGDGIRIQLAVWPGADPQVFCVHGLTANCRCWDTVAEALAPRYGLLALDLRGRGLSDAPETGYSVAQHCRDLLAVMQERGSDRPVLMGHSMGALVVLAFAALHPERTRGIILVDGAGVLDEDQMQRVFNAIRPSLERLGQHFRSFDDYVVHMQSASFFQPWNAAIETYFRHEVETVAQGVRSRVRPETIAEEVENLRSVSAAEFYPGVDCPVLILRATVGIAGGEDLVLPASAAARMRRELVHAKLVELPGTHHYSILFQPNSLRDRTLLDFLRRLAVTPNP